MSWGPKGTGTHQPNTKHQTKPNQTNKTPHTSLLCVDRPLQRCSFTSVWWVVTRYIADKRSVLAIKPSRVSSLCTFSSTFSSSHRIPCSLGFLVPNGKHDGSEARLLGDDWLWMSRNVFFFFFFGANVCERGGRHEMIPNFLTNSLSVHDFDWCSVVEQPTASKTDSHSLLHSSIARIEIARQLNEMHHPFDTKSHRFSHTDHTSAHHRVRAKPAPAWYRNYAHKYKHNRFLYAIFSFCHAFIYALWSNNKLLLYPFILQTARARGGKKRKKKRRLWISRIQQV